MTVSSTSSRKSFTGDGVTTSFGTSPVVFFETSNLVVYVVTTATGASTTLTENTHYTVTGGDGTTGTVNLAGGSSPYGAPSALQTLVIVRELPLTQEADFVNNDINDAEVLEDVVDRSILIDQQLEAVIDRSFRLADSDVSGASLVLPTPKASKVIGWDSAGTALQNYSAADINASLVSTFGATLIDDADAAAARVTLGFVAPTAWTPVLTFATPGNLSVAYSVQAGFYTKKGREVTAFFNLQLSSFTHTTASGNLQITGLPFASDSTANLVAVGGSPIWRGITKANYTDVVSVITAGVSLITVSASGSGQANSNVAAADMPTGGTVAFLGSITYFTAS